MSKTANDYVTKKEFRDAFTELKHEMQTSELRLSKQITKEITETFWKIVPLFVGLMALVNGVFFIAYKLS